MDEEHPLNPRSPYAATKAGGDRLVYSYFTTYELPVVIVRPFNNYGPFQHPEKVVPALHHPGAAGRAADDPRRGAREPRLALRRRRRRGDRGGDRGRHRIGRRRGDQRRDGCRHRSERDRGHGARGAREARLAEDPRQRAARPGRPAHRLDGEGRAAARLAGAYRRSRRASSARSPGTSTTVPGGNRFFGARPPSPRPRGGPGAARAPAGSARARPVRDRLRPRPGGAGLRVRRPARARLGRGRGGPRPARSRRGGRRPHLAGHRLAGRDRRPGRRAHRRPSSDRPGDGGPLRLEAPPARRLAEAGVPQPRLAVCASLDEAAPAAARSASRASSRLPTARASAACPCVEDPERARAMPSSRRSSRPRDRLCLSRS